MDYKQNPIKYYLQESYFNISTVKLKVKIALTGVAQWTGCWPVNQKVAGLIPSQGTGLDCSPGLQ